MNKVNPRTDHRGSMFVRTTSWLNTFRRSFIPLLLVLALLMGAFSQSVQASSSESRVLPQLLNEANNKPGESFRVIVTRKEKDPKADGKVDEFGGKKVKDIAAEAFVAIIPGAKIAALGKDPSVKYVSLDAPMIKTGIIDSSKLATLYPKVVQATGLWSGSNPITGAGIGVAVIDTGINTSHPDWKDASGNSRIAAKVLFNSSLEKTNDGHGHGTHVAGIIAGNSWKRGDTALQGKYVGIAPDARLINVRVADETGMSYVSDVVNAIDWVIANRTNYNIRVMNLSLVSSVAESAKTSTLAGAVERAWFNGIFVVVSSGNSGPDTMHYPPANDPFVVTVGASDTMGTTIATDDGLAPWSSYGLTQDGHAKPEVVAPGRSITSVLASSNSTLAANFPSRVSDGNYIWMSGSSMASPIVAGIAALAFQAHPEWTNDQVKWLLMNTATKLKMGGTSLLPGQGSGQVNAELVVRYAGTPGFANQGLTISEQLSITSGGTTYDSASWNTASWNTASWNTASWNTASWNTASWNTNNFSTASWNSAVEIDQP